MTAPVAVRSSCSYIENFFQEDKTYTYGGNGDEPKQFNVDSIRQNEDGPFHHPAYALTPNTVELILTLGALFIFFFIITLKPIVE